MMKALVTGFAGFVGRHVVQRLLTEGWHVTGWDNMSSGLPLSEWKHWKQEPPHKWVTADLRDMVKCSSPNDFDLIIHCAAVVGGRLKIEGDPLAVATDLAIDSDFFNWVVRAKNHPKVIYFSSSAVYPIELQSRTQHMKMIETLTNFDTTRIAFPDMTYGWSKLTGEYLAQYAAKHYGLDVVIYRPFSGYGVDQSLDYPFTSIIQRAAYREDPLTIWGSGDQVRDFVHIDDAVAAVFATMNQLKPGEVLNLGTGVPTSFKQLAELACLAVGYKPEIVCDTTKPEGVFWRVADTYKLRSLYSFEARLGQRVAECVDVLDTAEALV